MHNNRGAHEGIKKNFLFLLLAAGLLLLGAQSAYAADTWSVPGNPVIRGDVLDMGSKQIKLSQLPTGQLGVTQCKPGPPSYPAYGSDGLPCAAMGLTAGLFVTGICQAGSCRAIGFTTPTSALSNFLNGVANSALQGVAQQLIGGIFGGGGSYYGQYDDASPTTTSLEDIDFSDLTTGTDLTGFDWNFDTDTNTTNLEYTTTNTPTPVVIVTTPYAQPATITQELYTTNTQTTEGVSTIPGSSQFEQDLVGITFNTDADSGGGRTLSLADLERAAQEARLREAMNSERQASTDGLRDYRGSNIGNSTGVSDPNAVDTPTKKPWWVTVVEFVGSLFGVAN